MNGDGMANGETVRDSPVVVPIDHYLTASMPSAALTVPDAVV
jgi:hypothetical protein